MTGQGTRESPLGSPSHERLHQMIFGGPFQPGLFYSSVAVAGCNALTFGTVLLFFQSLCFFLRGHCSGGSFPHKILTLHFEMKSQLSVLMVAVKGL